MCCEDADCARRDFGFALALSKIVRSSNNAPRKPTSSIPTNSADTSVLLFSSRFPRRARLSADRRDAGDGGHFEAASRFARERPRTSNGALGVKTRRERRWRSARRSAGACGRGRRRTLIASRRERRGRAGSGGAIDTARGGTTWIGVRRRAREASRRLGEDAWIAENDRGSRTPTTDERPGWTPWRRSSRRFKIRRRAHCPVQETRHVRGPGARVLWSLLWNHPRAAAGDRLHLPAALAAVARNASNRVCNAWRCCSASRRTRRRARSS